MKNPKLIFTLISIFALVLTDNFSFTISANRHDNNQDQNLEFHHLQEEEGFETIDGDGEQDYSSSSLFDDKDIFVLKENNFTKIVKKNRYVMVVFYEPWSKECQDMELDYANSAKELKGEVVMAKVDATEEYELAQKYKVETFPTVFFFINGVHKPYLGLNNKEAIVKWIRKKIGPGIRTISTKEDAESILKTENKLVMCFLNSLVGPENDVLVAASRQEDDVSFYRTSNPEVAKLFHIDPNADRPSLVLLKKDHEKLSHFNSKFTKLEISKFVLLNKLPLVTRFTKETARMIYENPIKKQILLFDTSSGSKKVFPAFEEAAKFFKGKIIFVHVELDDGSVGRPLSDFFGVNGDRLSIIAYTGNEDGKKYFFDNEATNENIKAFGKDFLEGKLTPFYKSDPIPEINNGDVKIVVGKNFDKIVLDESKNVLLEMYAPWCEYCIELEPKYEKLAKELRAVDSFVIAKMDGSSNEHPMVKVDGFPTFLFFPAGNKTSDPIVIESDGNLAEIVKYLKKHASIPSKVQKQASSGDNAGANKRKQRNNNKKDEL